MIRIIGAGLLTVAVGLAAGALLLYFRSDTGSGPADGPDGGAANSGQLTGAFVNDLGPVKVQSTSMSRFEFRNESGHTIRIIGAADGCRAGLCVFMRTELPLEVPAGQATSLEFDCHLGKPGLFMEHVSVYTDEPTQAVIKLTITGEVVE